MIYASPLKRAFSTAQAVWDAQSLPKPPLSPSPSLREQHWGAAEGHSWLSAQDPGLTLDEHFARGLYPILHERAQKFPGGESLDDLAQRAEQAVAELLMRHVWATAREGKHGVHVAVVSHGLCISELVRALVRLDASGADPGDRYKGLRNTAWTRIAVDVKVSPSKGICISDV